VAIDDAAPIEIVRRELHPDAVAQKNPDAVAAHLPGRIAESLVAVVQEDAEHAVPQSLHDLALHLDLFFLDWDEALSRVGVTAPGRRSSPPAPSDPRGPRTRPSRPR